MFFFSLLKAVQNPLKILPVPFTMLISRVCWDWWTKLSAYYDADVTTLEIRCPREVEKKPWERGWTRLWCPRWNPLIYIAINLNFALKLLGQFASEKECFEHSNCRSWKILILLGASWKLKDRSHQQALIRNGDSVKIQNSSSVSIMND